MTILFGVSDRDPTLPERIPAGCKSSGVLRDEVTGHGDGGYLSPSVSLVH